MKTWLFNHAFQVLDIFKAVGLLVLIVMFVNFNLKLADSVQAARTTANSTNKIVKSQNDILNAIKKLAEDNKRTSEQKTDIIICMLQVPVNQRTTNTVEGCRKQVDEGTFPSSAANSSASGNTSNKASNQPDNQSSNGSSNNSTTPSNSSQHNNPQGPLNCKFDFFRIHLACP